MPSEMILRSLELPQFTTKQTNFTMTGKKSITDKRNGWMTFNSPSNKLAISEELGIDYQQNKSAISVQTSKRWAALSPTEKAEWGTDEKKAQYPKGGV